MRNSELGVERGSGDENRRVEARRQQKRGRAVETVKIARRDAVRARFPKRIQISLRRDAIPLRNRRVDERPKMITVASRVEARRFEPAFLINPLQPFRRGDASGAPIDV